MWFLDIFCCFLFFFSFVLWPSTSAKLLWKRFFHFLIFGPFFVVFYFSFHFCYDLPQVSNCNADWGLITAAGEAYDSGRGGLFVCVFVCVFSSFGVVVVVVVVLWCGCGVVVVVLLWCGVVVFFFVKAILLFFDFWTIFSFSFLLWPSTSDKLVRKRFFHFYFCPFF